MHKLKLTFIYALTTFAPFSAMAVYTPTLGSNSLYDITEVSSPDNADFTYIETLEDGSFTEKYYTISIKDNQTSLERIDSNQGGNDITGNFFNLTEQNGAAIFNRAMTVFADWKIGTIRGDFYNNTAEGDVSNGPQGGAVYNRPLGGQVSSIEQIIGDFIKNSAVSDSLYPSYGGAVYNSAWAVNQTASIGQIEGNFINNSVVNQNHQAYGGAIYNYGVSGTNVIIGTISGSFIGNYVQGANLAVGGAIYTSSSITFASNGKNIQFQGNYSEDENGKVNNAIFAETGVNDVTLTFDTSAGGNILFFDEIDGGAVNSLGTGIDRTGAYFIVLNGQGMENGTMFANTINYTAGITVNNSKLEMSDFNGNFGNFGTQSASVTLNNALLDLNYSVYRSLKINELTAEGNSMIAFGADFYQGTSDSFDIGTASGSVGIYNIHFDNFGNVGDRITLFNNYILDINNLDTYTKIYNNLTYKFEQDGAQLVVASKTLERPESLVEENEILDVQDTHINDGSFGILTNNGLTTIVDSSFENNQNNTNGGVLTNYGQLIIQNTDFSNNTSDTNGGAIYNAGDITLTADNYDMKFSGNTDSSGSNDIYLAQQKTLNLNIYNNGSLSFDGGINGEKGYEINVYGDGSGKLSLESNISNAAQINVYDTSVILADNASVDGSSLYLSNSTFDMANNNIGQIDLNNLNASKAFISLDVDTQNNVSDILNIAGDLSGTTNLILNMLSSKQQTADIVFAYTPNDDTATDGNFLISRIIGNPYVYNIYANYDEATKSWLFTTDYSSNDDDDNTEVGDNDTDDTEDDAVDDGNGSGNSNVNTTNVAPEFVSYIGLPRAAVEMTGNIHKLVSDKIASGKILSTNCNGVYDEAFDGNPFINSWVNVEYTRADIKEITNMDADIFGIAAGFDLQADINHKYGLFAAYQNGDFSLSGKGENYYSEIGSDIKIKNYIGGLYYRYDSYGLYAVGTVFGGIQKADLDTKDKIVNTDTEADIWGGGLDLGYIYGLNKTSTLEPYISLNYNYINYENLYDNIGNFAKFEDINYFEAELGLKLEKVFYNDYAVSKIYIRPSVIQTFGNKATVHADNLLSADALEHQLYGKLEIGGKYGITENLSFYGGAYYVYGDDYEAQNINFGLTYSW